MIINHVVWKPICLHDVKVIIYAKFLKYFCFPLMHVWNLGITYRHKGKVFLVLTIYGFLYPFKRNEDEHFVKADTIYLLFCIKHLSPHIGILHIVMVDMPFNASFCPLLFPVPFFLVKLVNLWSWKSVHVH